MYRLKGLPNNRHQSERQRKARKTYLTFAPEDRRQKERGKRRVAAAENS